MQNVALDIAIGLTFIYLLYSLLATTIKEIVATIFSYRSRMLERGIQQMLDGNNVKYFWWNKLINHLKGGTSNIPKSAKAVKKESFFAADVINHPIYKRAADKSLWNKPSYLNATTFSDILIDLFQANKTAPVLLKEISQVIETKAKTGEITPDLKAILNIYIQQANGDVQRFRWLIENWYDDMMDRVSGWYKRQATRILIIIGLVLAVIFNVSTIEIVNNLSADKAARDALVQNASDYVKTHSGPTDASKQEPPKLPQTPAQKAQSNAPGKSDKTGSEKDSTNKQAVKKAASTYASISDNSAKNKPAGNIDSTSTTSNPDDSAQFLADARSKIRQMQRLYNEEIAKNNSVMGLGWGDYGYSDDSAAYVKGQLKCGKPEHKGFFGKIGYVLGKTITTPRKWLGFLLTAFAISLGAPFWFDLLNKFVNMRVSGKKPDDNSPNTAPSKTVKLNQIPDPSAKG
jgi:hypothetical protein